MKNKKNEKKEGNNADFYTPVLTVFQIQQNSEGTHGLAHLTSATKKKE